MSTIASFLEKLYLRPFPFFLPFLLLAIFLGKILYSSLVCSKNPPPSPPRLPIIGNLHQLSLSLHRSLLPLSQRYGELMLVHMGSKPALLVSSAAAVSEITKTHESRVHDMIFSNRAASRIVSRIFYAAKDVAFSPYGEHWKLQRSICVSQLLSNQKLQSFRTIREEETALMVETIHRLNSSVVNLSEIALTISHNVTCRETFGRKYNKNHKCSKFKELLKEAMEFTGTYSFGYFIPWLSWLDRVKGLNGLVEKVAKELDEILETLVQECQHRLINNDKGKKENNFVETLLECQRENNDILTIESIKAMILDMFAGTHSISTAIEWRMNELIKHPRVMKKVQEEVRKVIKSKGRIICENDLEKLIYLRVVIKESLRLHPQLLIFRETSSDVKINGFNIAAGTQVIINAWAIQRDPMYWEEPEEFHPERFYNNTTSFDFHYIPFGMGRRGCPGISFANVVTELVVANLVYEFDWKLPGDVECEMLEMEEALGVAVHRRVPLMVIASPHGKSDMNEVMM